MARSGTVARRWGRRLIFPVLLALGLVSVAACGGGDDASADSTRTEGTDLGGETISIASGFTTESRLLAALAAAALEDRGATVERVEESSRERRRALLASGDLDVYWDRARTAWGTEVERDPAASVPASILDDVALADRALNNFRWLSPAGYASGPGFVVAAAGDEPPISSVRELNDVDLPLCVEPWFATEPHGLDRLEASIGAIAPERLIEVDAGQIPGEVEAGVCVGQIERTSAVLAETESLVVLDDDEVLGPEIPVPVVRLAEVTERADIVAVLNRVAPTITLPIMQRLIRQVERDGLDVDTVAVGFLVARAMIDARTTG